MASARKIPDVISHKSFIKLMKSIKYNNKIKEKKIRTAFALGFYGLLRVSEVVNLTQDNIDRELGFLIIRQAKGKKDRQVPIPKPLLKFLREVPLDYSARTLQREMRYWARKTLNKSLHFHTLRHAGASFCLNELKMDLRYIQVILGHSRISTTEIYTHVRPSQLKKTVSELWENYEDDE